VSEVALAGLEPALVWERFSELTRIARPSKAEGPAREHVLGWARARDLDAAADDEGNVVVRVPASIGRESAATVVLQSHLDMVCERDPASPYDPREGRISVRIDGDWVVADGTTLGADNGIGVAAALAVADEPGLVHGPLELLFTVSEEQGLDGAKALDASLVSGRLLVNLDGTSDDALTVGCAGSDHTFLRLALSPEPVPPDHVVVHIEVSGARGGHSGEDIASGRVSAIKALGRVLSAVYRESPFQLVSLAGGVSRNAIPRQSHAVVALPAAADAAIRAAADEELAAILRQFAGTDDGLVLSIGEAEADAAASPDTTGTALDLLASIPSGLVALDPSVNRATQTSTCLTVAGTEHGTLSLASMARSSNAAALDELRDRMASLARLAGAEIEVRRSYPPWEPRRESPLLARAKETYSRLYGVDPALTVVHGGLECAVLGQKLPGVDMVSIGPEIVGPHAPGEKVRISSTQRFYRLLAALLDDLSR
jgi:dipeptidase D